MAQVGPEAELRTLMECRYQNPTEALQDLHTVRARFSDLRLYVDFYCFPNNEKRKLVYLSGTLPVLFEGSEYNLPVCIWLHETHPALCPCCFVCPSPTMVINRSCPFVDATGSVSLDGLRNWTHGTSNLSLLMSEMRRAFQKDTPLYVRCPMLAPPSAHAKILAGKSPAPAGAAESQNHISSSQLLTLYPGSTSSHLSAVTVSRMKTSYTEDLLGIDFSAPPSSSHSPSNPFLSSSSSSGTPLTEPLSSMMGALTLDGGSSRDLLVGSPAWTGQSEPEPAKHGSGSQSGSAPGPDLKKLAVQLSPDQMEVFLALMTIQGRSFNPDDVIEAVQNNQDLPSALRFLTHTCPICHDQVSFSKMITMTHCSCFLCQKCFISFFSVTIRESSVQQLTCPLCRRPELPVQGCLEGAVDYFNLLDTQIRHFLPAELHELFQRKLRDRALQDMPSFCWCAHCSFGMLHEADRLRMDCPSCKKSTCSGCRSAWSPQHQGLSCEQFSMLQQQQLSCPRLQHTIECPQCRCVFSLSKGGCLHFTCSQCLHQFCGGCSQRFALGSDCRFSAECRSKGLHAHHPRDCLYHLRDWSVSRLHLLLQYYRVSPSCLEPASTSWTDSGQTVTCCVLELREDGGRTWDRPCGQPAPPEYRGYCHRRHYKEQMVELIKQCGADPAVLFSPSEMVSELQRWQVPVPTQTSEEPELLYAHRLRLVLTNSVPLKKQPHPPAVTSAEAPPPPQQVNN
ncbi:E3 ubiquitin-protein ligase RNF31 isoform X3 [Austrofundulus limnaeus]|uniref:E3 ubiquitin-protein ligase RNF31 isoform X3 n=1 Tax=Austrofundulus limnaeus TaxID=52670 RepID=A0A2I4AI81_AUSLI|nr:PREDICTED: E3 ubiquitin-protein ligase RNF31-like isoform X3 [Austrofundulus limnaeus]